MSSVFKHMHVSTFQTSLFELRVPIGSSQKLKHLPPLHRIITKFVCVCVCGLVLFYSILFYLVSAPQSPLPSTPAWDCFFFLNTHHLSINFPSVFPIYLTLTCTNAQTHALRSSKTRKRAIKRHVATRLDLRKNATEP